MKKTYTITFKAELTEDDVKAMNGCFYQAMNESMEISEVWGLEIREADNDFEGRPPEIKEAQKYTPHIDDVIDGLMACETIDEVEDYLDTIPRKFGEWWVDTIGEGEDAYYEVTNEWWDSMNEELCVNTYQLEIEVEEEE